MPKTEPFPIKLSDDPLWQRIYQLLRTADYELAAELLATAQRESEQNGQAAQSAILAAACHICLTCHQCRVGAEWFWQAYQESSGREQELNQQLSAILELIGTRDTLEVGTSVSASIVEASPSEREIAELAAPHRLWKRIQGLLGLRPGPQALEPERKLLDISDETLTSIPIEKVNISLAPLLDDMAEMPIASPVEEAEEALLALLSEKKTEILIQPPAEEVSSLLVLPPEQPELLALSPMEEIETPLVVLSTEIEPAIVTPIQEVEVQANSLIIEAEAAVTPQVVKEEMVEEQDLPALVIYCLGSFRVFQDDQLIRGWSSLKGQSILKYLILHKGRPVAKDVLMDVFWPDTDPGDTRRNLHQAIYSLRHTLRSGQGDLQPILFKNDCYLLNPELVIWLDFQEFEKHVQAGRRLEIAEQPAQAMTEYSIAEGLYQGDFLEEDLYEDWATLLREHLRNLYLDIANRLSEHYIRQGEYAAVIALCQKILAKDNCYEEAYRRLMRCYLAQRQRHLAVRHYQTCVQALKEELDLPPSEDTVALYRRITSGA